MENKQTAVEWLVDQIKSDQNQKTLSASEWMQVIERAKEMEKEQILKLEHHKDFTVGLWATDRPDLIQDPNNVLFQINF